MQNVVMLSVFMLNVVAPRYITQNDLITNTMVIFYGILTLERGVVVVNYHAIAVYKIGPKALSKWKEGDWSEAFFGGQTMTLLNDHLPLKTLQVRP
jgi:hypothetical protein